MLASPATVRHEFRRRNEISAVDNRNMFLYLLQRQLICQIVLMWSSNIYFIHLSLLKISFSQCLKFLTREITTIHVYGKVNYQTGFFDRAYLMRRMHAFQRYNRLLYHTVKIAWGSFSLIMVSNYLWKFLNFNRKTSLHRRFDSKSLKETDFKATISSIPM